MSCKWFRSAFFRLSAVFRPGIAEIRTPRDDAPAADCPGSPESRTISRIDSPRIAARRNARAAPPFSGNARTAWEMQESPAGPGQTSRSFPRCVDMAVNRFGSGPNCPIRSPRSCSRSAVLDRSAMGATPRAQFRRRAVPQAIRRAESCRIARDRKPLCRLGIVGAGSPFAVDLSPSRRRSRTPGAPRLAFLPNGRIMRRARKNRAMPTNRKRSSATGQSIGPGRAGAICGRRSGKGSSRANGDVAKPRGAPRHADAGYHDGKRRASPREDARRGQLRSRTSAESSPRWEMTRNLS